MSDVLAIFGAEMAGILAWAVVGSLMRQSNGLDMVPAVENDTKDYRTEQDTVQTFLDERLEMHPDHSILKDVLYREWRQGCKDNGEKAAIRRSKTWFT